MITAPTLPTAAELELDFALDQQLPEAKIIFVTVPEPIESDSF